MQNWLKLEPNRPRIVTNTTNLKYLPLLKTQ